MDEYKSELDRVARDSRDLEAELAEGAGLVKSSLLDEAHSRVTALEIEIANLQGTITQLTAANTTLDAEVNDLMRRVASGEYNTATERVVELRDNPATRIMAVRKKQLEDLRRENEALLRAGAGAGAGGAAGGGAAAGAAAAAGAGAAAEAGAAEGATVPRESWDRLVKEKEEMEQAHQKRLQRLKEVCPGNATLSTSSLVFTSCVHAPREPTLHSSADALLVLDIRQQEQRIPRGRLLALGLANQV